MHFLSPDLEDYIANHSQNEPEILQELDRETHLKVVSPRMLSGHVQGRFLSQISHMMQPKRILEIGTYTGYSALSLAEGLAKDGQLHTIDINEELEPFVAKYISKAGLENQITQHIGKALDIIPTLNETWDIVFIDADKPNYSNYYHAIIDSVRPGGIILTDNVLWSGKVVQNLEKPDKSTKALLEFNKMVQNDNRVDNVLVGIRDGLMLARKL